MRQISLVDHILSDLQTVLFRHPSPACPPPGELDLASPTPSHRMASGKMRVNHSGEVCAQALYVGQALVARHPVIRHHLLQAANEELQHLRWCEERLNALQTSPSYLNPIWYTASLLIGAWAGLQGDAFSLGFVAETELQVSQHLERHIQNWPSDDRISLAVLRQMQIDEQKHGLQAQAAGGQSLPPPIPTLMRVTARMMTTLSQYI